MAQVLVQWGDFNCTMPRGIWVLKGTITRGMKIHNYSPCSSYVRMYSYGVRSETKICTEVFGRGTSQIPPILHSKWRNRRKPTCPLSDMYKPDRIVRGILCLSVRPHLSTTGPVDEFWRHLILVVLTKICRSVLIFANTDIGLLSFAQDKIPAESVALVWCERLMKLW
jgi:hypothetical protein